MKEQNDEQRKTRGGRRPGAGRPVTVDGTRTIGLRIPADVAEILDRQENRSAYIIEAIRAYEASRRKRTIFGVEISYTKER